jgi:hypothetical protein
MKKLILIYSLLVLTGSIPAKANKPADSTEIRNNKKGWNFGLVPAVSYDTDLGYQYGAAVNFYDYGDGSKFPPTATPSILKFHAILRAAGFIDCFMIQNTWFQKSRSQPTLAIFQS